MLLRAVRHLLIRLLRPMCDAFLTCPSLSYCPGRSGGLHRWTLNPDVLDGGCKAAAGHVCTARLSA
eukprot:364208-Chlamydomonas_euryale.AAC.31